MTRLECYLELACLYFIHSDHFAVSERAKEFWSERGWYYLLLWAKGQKHD